MEITEEKIKAIPKYILQKIRRLDDKYNPSPKGQCRFYAYLTKIQGELTKVTVAVKHYRKKWYCNPGPGPAKNSDICFDKNY